MLLTSLFTKLCMLEWPRRSSDEAFDELNKAIPALKNISYYSVGRRRLSLADGVGEGVEESSWVGWLRVKDSRCTVGR